MESQSVTAAGTAGSRILVADDGAENRDILSRQLQSENYTVRVAEDGEQALKLLRSEKFDLVLLDVIMPKVDGFEVLREMKAVPAMHDIPVIVISALDDTLGVIRCIQMGAEDYLTKPFNPTLLRARIGASLSKKRLRDQLAMQEHLASLGALTAGIAHEIRNPLNFVTNFAAAAREVVKEMLGKLSDGNPDEIRALFGQLQLYADKIEEHGRRADRIVRGMLMHSRGKSGEREPVDTRNLLEDSLNLAYHALRAQERDFSARIETDIDANVGKVFGVPQDLSRVFLNILNNAFYAVWKRSKREGVEFHPTVKVSAHGDESKIEVRITDNGGGIPRAVLPQIFKPFFTTKPAGAGTGLGLSISHDIVVQGHHGSIRAESERTTGETTFVVTLPRGEA